MSARQLKVAVLMGGPSAEAEVSRVSAAEVAQALETAGHKPTLIELDTQVTSEVLQLAPDVVFPALHGPPGEDGTVQGFLEILGLPCVGSDVHGSAAAMDKSLAKSVFQRAGLPVLDDLLVRTDQAPARIAETIFAAFGERVVLKPLGQGSAIGVTRVTGNMDLEQAVRSAIASQPRERALLVEPFVDGREVTVGVLDLHGSEPRAFPVIEITTAEDEWYDYTNRYDPAKSQHLIPAPLGAETSEWLQSIALDAHSELGLRDLSRADYLVANDDVYLLEVNSLPGMTPTSLYPDGARAIGMDFPTLLDALVQSAYQRG